MNVELETFSI